MKKPLMEWIFSCYKKNFYEMIYGMVHFQGFSRPLANFKHLQGLEKIMQIQGFSGPVQNLNL